MGRRGERTGLSYTRQNRKQTSGKNSSQFSVWDVVDKFFEHSREWHCVTDFSGTILKTNRPPEELNGSDPESLKGKSLFDWIHPAFSEVEARLTQGIGLKEEEVYLKNPGKGSVRLRLNATILEGSELILCSFFRLGSEDLLNPVFDDSSEGLLVVSEGRLVKTNEAFRTMTGFSSDKLDGILFSALLHPGDKTGWTDFLEFRQTTKQEIAIVDAKGNPLPVWVKVKRISQPSSTILLVTVKRKADETASLSRSVNLLTQQIDRIRTEFQDFAELGAKQLKQPLKLIADHKRWLSNELISETTDKAAPLIDYALDETRKAQRVFQKMALYARLNQEAFLTEKLSGKEILDEAIQAIYPLVWDTKAEIRYGYLPTISGNREFLVHLFAQLLENSLKHKADIRPLVKVSFSSQGEFFKCSLRDNGSGMSKEDLRNAFRLFYANKPESAGLGLSISQKIVLLHQGKIWIEPNRNQGITINFTLRK